MIPVFTNHMWQSTLFALLAGLVTLALRGNRALTRYRVWMAASVKFFVPFSVLVMLGGHLSWRTAPAVDAPAMALAIEQTAQTLVAPVAAAGVVKGTTIDPVPIIGLVWGCGVLVVLCHWLARWRSVRAVVRAASPFDLDFPVPVRTSNSLIEPGVFGILRPVLLLPAGIVERLTPEQLQAILIHEATHVRRRDNLTAFLHMLVEAGFWFHPLVWWIGAKLVDERERACDEEVLRFGSEPHTYAEGILSICKLCVESPLACVSGVTGANLRKRIEAIMSNGIATELSQVKKAGLAAMTIAVVAGPVIVGIVDAPPIRAQQIIAPVAKFDVASIKRTPPGTPRFSVTDKGALAMVYSLGHSVVPAHGKIDIPAFTLKWLIITAYDVKDTQVMGGPSWASSDHYDVMAKAADGNAAFDQMRPMLQSLLAERFQLVVHHEIRELPIYELVAAKGGLKIEAAKDGSCDAFDPDAPRPRLDPKHPAAHPNICGGWWRRVMSSTPDRRDQLEALSISMPRLIEILAQEVNDRFIVDKTGFKKKFDFRLDFAPTPGSGGMMPVPPLEPGVSANMPSPSIFTALQEQLGLRLESAKGSVDVLVIDRVERPSEN
jgi:bla regulator protein blaR1